MKQVALQISLKRNLSVERLEVFNVGGCHANSDSHKNKYTQGKQGALNISLIKE